MVGETFSGILQGSVEEVNSNLMKIEDDIKVGKCCDSYKCRYGYALET